MKRNWNLSATVNFVEGERECEVEFETLGGLIAMILDTMSEEHAATSFVFTIVPARPR